MDSAPGPGESRNTVPLRYSRAATGQGVPVTAPTSLRTANPRRTTLAALRAGVRCEVAAAGCRTTATRLVEGRHACSTCASR